MDSPQKISASILEGYENYILLFDKISHRARTRFETRDWHGIQADSKERLYLYKTTAKEKAIELVRNLDNPALDRELWKLIKKEYAYQIAERNDSEIAETFFNSVVRKMFENVVIEEETMFVLLEKSLEEMESEEKLYRTYSGKLQPEEMVRQVLLDFKHDVLYQDLERDIQSIVYSVKKNLLAHYKPDRETRVEIIKSIFYRNKAAYIVGRTIIAGSIVPFVLPMLNKEDGIFVDTVIFNPNEVSTIFSFTRSYFMVDVPIPFEMVNFLKSLMPEKRFSELYNSIGFNKHGKTVFYRSLLNHLEKSNDKFVIAPGIKGMVMTVFTLPSYPVVFKLIKDKFDPPKKTNRLQVKEKYKLVSVHDRVGRMADTHEFEHFVLPSDRFSKELKIELQNTVASLIHDNGNKTTIDHLYTERRMIPLNLFLEEADETDAEIVVKDYGNAIKQLAAANIFPGDMLLKNFGVTRHGRVVFYDYDEICHITECRFRDLPEPRDDYEAYSSEAWFSVEENDIFPEEFRKFLIGRIEIRDLFYKHHMDLFESRYWNAIKLKLLDGEIVDVYPYPDGVRFSG